MRRQRRWIPADIFPLGESYRRHRRFACDIRRRLRCTAYRRVLSGTLGRHPWPEDCADPLHVPDGASPRSLVGLLPTYQQVDRLWRWCSGCHLAPRPGLRGRRRNIRGQFNDPGTCSIWPARILCVLSRCKAYRPGKFLRRQFSCHSAAYMPNEAFNSWGWRIPFLLSFFVIVAG